MSSHDLQQTILRQVAVSSLIDGQIDIHQDKVVQLLKRAIVEKHLFAQRVFITEYFNESGNEDVSLLNNKVFQSDEPDVFDNFAALLLPPEFTKGPMKAFINTLLESLESFLPAFNRLTPSKLPSSNCFASPGDVLVRCVFPTLFGYCWATEPATAYAENLVKWFGELYLQKHDFVSNFGSEWMFNAMRGLFTSLDFQAFIVSAIRPVFYEYVQEVARRQKEIDFLFYLASKLLINFVDYYYLIPDVMNTFFTLLRAELKRIVGENGIDADEQFNTMVKYLFYDGIIEIFFKHPMLYISDIPIPKEDIADFIDIYNVFKVKLGKTQGISDDFIKSVTESSQFEGFDPMIILEKILGNAATGRLPSLQEFCNIAQCAHQPLLMSTHHLSLLFRFVASLQHLAILPTSIDRSIALVFQNSLADQLEVVDDEYFWFQCYSLKYMNIEPTSFEKQMKLSPIYRLLSNKDLYLADDDDFSQALIKTENNTNVAMHPDIKTEIQWLKYCSGDLNTLVEPLKEEISKRDKEIKVRRKRARRLNAFARTLEALINGIPIKNSKMAMGLSLSSAFDKIKARSFIEQGLTIFEEKCKNANKTIGPYIAAGIIMHLSPNVKQGSKKEFTYGTDVARKLQHMVRSPIITSSLIPDAIRLAQDCVTILKYASEAHVDNSLSRCFKSPFMDGVETIAQNLSNCLSYFPNELLMCIFTQEEWMALSAFFASFT